MIHSSGMNLKKIFLLSALILLSFLSWSQATAPWSYKVATYGDLYMPQNKSAMPDAVFFDLNETPGFLQEGEKLDVICEEGTRYTFSYLRTEAIPLSHRMRIYLKPIADPSKLMMEFEHVYFIVPAGTTIFDEKDVEDLSGISAEVDPAPSLTPVIFTRINGVEWSGGVFPNSALYYEKGNSVADPSGKPILILAFKAAQGPDNRQLTLRIRDFNGPGSYSRAEILLSGSENGDPAQALMHGRQDNPDFPEQKTNFTLDVSDWHRPADNMAFITCSFSGKLKGLLGAPDVELTGGSFQKVEVMIYTEKY
jgi:hypothetical protein